MVRDMVHKFLDNYVGDGIKRTIRKTPLYDPLLNRTNKMVNTIMSEDNTIILFFEVNHIGGVDVYFDSDLIETICNMFSLLPGQTREYLRSWFCKRHKINDNRELLNYPAK